MEFSNECWGHLLRYLIPTLYHIRQTNEVIWQTGVKFYYKALGLEPVFEGKIYKQLTNVTLYGL